MALSDVNLNRGLVQMPLPNSGPLISMCKTVPGVYFDSSGNSVSDEMAAQAGFDVPLHKRLRAKDEALNKAKAKIESEFEKASTEIDGMSDDELAEAAGSEPEPAATKQDDGEPFIQRNSKQEPRAARVVKGGDVREMVYDASSGTWAVNNRTTGKVVEDGLEKEDAIELLLAE